MFRLGLSTLLLVGCAHRPDAPAQECPAARASAEIEPPAPMSVTVNTLVASPDPGRWAHGEVSDAASLRDAPAIALVRVEHTLEECSAAGGSHVIFRVVHLARGEELSLVHHGGHAYYPAREFRVGDLFVAGLARGERPIDDSEPARCVFDLPSTDGFAGPLMHVPDATLGRALADSLAGYP